MSCVSSLRNSLSVGGVSSDTVVLLLSNGTMSPFIASITQMHVSPIMCIMSIANSERLPQCGLLSYRLLNYRESASAAWCLISALWTTKSSYFVSCNRQYVSLLVLSVRVKGQLSEL